MKKESVSVVDQEETPTVFTSSSIATIPKEKLSAKERLLVSKALKQSTYNELKDTASSTANIAGTILLLLLSESPKRRGLAHYQTLIVYLVNNPLKWVVEVRHQEVEVEMTSRLQEEVPRFEMYHLCHRVDRYHQVVVNRDSNVVSQIQMKTTLQ